MPVGKADSVKQTKMYEGYVSNVNSGAVVSF
jgi:hypothetical protein